MHAFEYFGGVPDQILYDRMKNVYIGKIPGKSKFNDTLMGFALHYGFKPEVAPAYAAWVKGKVERAYSFIREGFWRGYGFICLETANCDLLAWLAKCIECRSIFYFPRTIDGMLIRTFESADFFENIQGYHNTMLSGGLAVHCSHLLESYSIEHIWRSKCQNKHKNPHAAI